MTSLSLSIQLSQCNPTGTEPGNGGQRNGSQESQTHKLLLFGHRNLIRNTTQTAEINIFKIRILLNLTFRIFVYMYTCIHVYIRNVKFSKMRILKMFITAVCVVFLIKSDLFLKSSRNIWHGAFLPNIKSESTESKNNIFRRSSTLICFNFQNSIRFINKFFDGTLDLAGSTVIN